MGYWLTLAILKGRPYNCYLCETVCYQDIRYKVIGLVTIG